MIYFSINSLVEPVGRLGLLRNPKFSVLSYLKVLYKTEVRMIKIKRRNIVKNASLCLAGATILNTLGCKKSIEQSKMSTPHNNSLFFKISLAQWSLHRSIENKEINVLDFASIAKNEFGVDAIEYVNGFYKEKANDKTFWSEVKRRADDQGVESLLIMVDDEGDLGDTSMNARTAAIENHFKWVDAAAQLGCHSVRINAFGDGSKEDVGLAMIDSLGKLCTYAKESDINVLIENHGLYSSDGLWVKDIITQVDMPNCGTLPDFGNFCLSKKWGSTQDGTCAEEYDRYRGVSDMMPYAVGVSAKSYSFDAEGNERLIDFDRMLRIVKDFNFNGYVGIEYEGSELSEFDGIMATKALLERIGTQIG